MSLLDINKYGQPDPDTEWFLNHFDEPSGSRVLEVGANESFAAYLLADSGHNVTGIDLRSFRAEIPPDVPDPLLNYRRLQGDFCAWPWGTEKFDCVYSVSAIEHFGLGAYGEPPALEQDATAMQGIWNVLRPGGSCYLIVPYGREFFSHREHWRVYDAAALRDRLVGRFTVEQELFLAGGDAIIDGHLRRARQPVTRAEADGYVGTPPHVSVFLKLRKII